MSASIFHATGKAVTVPSKVTEVESKMCQEDYEGAPSAGGLQAKSCCQSIQPSETLTLP